jgi:hypothetical protein
MEMSERARLVNCAKEQKLGFGEMPSMRALRAMQWMKARPERGEQIDVVMDHEEEESSVVGRFVLRN